MLDDAAIDDIETKLGTAADTEDTSAAADAAPRLVDTVCSVDPPL